MRNNTAGRTAPGNVAIAIALLAIVMVPHRGFAQAAASEGSSPANELKVAPNAPASQDPQTPTTGQAAGKPANVCEELKAHLQQQAKGAPPAGSTGGARPAATGPQTSGSQAAGPPAAPGGQTGAQVSADRTQQNSGLSAPIPPSSSSGNANVTLADAEQLLSAGDQRSCQAAVQRMRRAGVALPPSLIALAALKGELLETR
jgi:hypothetical protein